MTHEWDGETKIEQMDLDQIKSMLCPISNHDPLKCVGCKSVSGCPAGQRVNVLLDKETAKEKVSVTTMKNRLFAAELARSDDPVALMIKRTGCNYKAARQRISNWIKFYPDIMGHIVLPGVSRTDAIRKKLIDAIESGDPIKYYQTNGHTPQEAARKVIENGLLKFPDIKARYEKAGWGKEMKTDDEVSVEDFLKDIAPEATETAVERLSDLPPEEIPFEADKPVETQNKAVSGQTVINQELEKKYEQLSDEKERIREEIREREKRLAWLEEQQEAIVKVKNLLDPSTAIGKSLYTE